MKNEASMRPFPENLFYDINCPVPAETPEDFYASLMYVLYSIAPVRDVKVMLMRYKRGMSYDEIAEALDLSKQRVHAITQEVLGKITTNHASMLSKGMKAYMEDLLEDRINCMESTLEVAERETIKAEAYASGFRDGKNGVEPKANDDFSGVSIESLGMSVRMYNACLRNNVRTLSDILHAGDVVMSWRSFGAKCFHELCDILRSMNIDPQSYFHLAIMKFGLE